MDEKCANVAGHARARSQSRSSRPFQEILKSGPIPPVDHEDLKRTLGALSRRRLRVFIESNTEWQVCGEAENGKDAMVLVQRENPNALILDVLMAKMNGLDAARKISAISPKTGVVLFTGYACEHLLGEATSLGNRSVVSKDETGALLHLLAVLKEATGASCAA